MSAGQSLLELVWLKEARVSMPEGARKVLGCECAGRLIVVLRISNVR